MRDGMGSTREDMHNVYDLNGKKVQSGAERKSKAQRQPSTYKSGDAKRKAHSINQKKRRRILRGALFIFFVIAVLVSAVFGLSQVFCRVDTVTVKYTNKANESKRYYTDKNIIAGSGVENGDNLLFVSSADVSDKLEKNLPYISNAVVKKDFPSSVVIEITECKKVFAYKTKDGYCLADEKGKFIEMADGKKAEKYTVVTCSEVVTTTKGDVINVGKIDEETKTYPDTKKVLDYLELITKSGMNITAVDLRDLTDVSMTYDGRILVHVGKMSDEENGVTAWRKLQLAKNALEKQDEISKTQTGKLQLAISKKAFFTPDKDVPEKETTTAPESK